MTIEKRRNTKGKVVYCVRRYGKSYPNGQFFKRLGVGELAKRQAVRLDANLAQEEMVERFSLPADHTVADALDAMIAEKEPKVSPASIITYRPRAERLKAWFGDRLLATGQRAWIAELQALLVEEDQAMPKTINGYSSLLNQAFVFAVDSGWLPSNPISGYRRMKEGDPLDTWRAFTSEELERIAANLSHDWFGDAVLVLANTGMRTGEVRKMTWECVLPNRLRVRATASKSKATRFIPIPEPVQAILDKNRAADTRLPFPGVDAMPMNRSTLHKRWADLRIKVGVPGSRLHDFRHTYACRLALEGVPVHAAQKLLGHENIQTTMVYYRLTDEQVLDFGRGLRPLIPIGGNPT